MEKAVYLITGATDGIGKQTAFELLQRGAHVIIHGRSAKKAQGAADELRQSTKKDAVSAVYADLSLLSSVREMAEGLRQKNTKIDALINNAGVFQQERELSPDGLEITMAVNHFSHFLLTHELWPLLQKSEQGRVINLSSIAHSRGQLDLSDLTFKKDFDGYRAYAASKLANVLFTYALARRLTNKKITVNAAHPGVIGTKLLATGFGIGGGSLTQGAATSVLLATDPALSKVSGKYFADRRETPSSAQSHDKELQERFYALSCQLTGVNPIKA